MSRKVEATISEEELEGDFTAWVDGVTAKCSRCDHTTEAFGRSEASVRRCLFLLREECPMGESNYYVSDD
jgi:hypothetical protein